MEFRDIDAIQIYRHYSRGFPVYDDNITPLFLLLSPEHILTLLQCALLEGRILLFSVQPELVVNVTHTLRRLLFPWKYAGSFIPLLPSSMLFAVQVPGSFMIGVETVDARFFVSGRNGCVRARFRVTYFWWIWTRIASSWIRRIPFHRFFLTVVLFLTDHTDMVHSLMSTVQELRNSLIQRLSEFGWMHSS